MTARQWHYQGCGAYCANSYRRVRRIPVLLTALAVTGLCLTAIVTLYMAQIATQTLQNVVQMACNGLS